MMLELSFGLIFLIVFFIFLLFVLRADGDLTLMFFDRVSPKLDRFKGKVMWITGASSGIGASMAREAAKQGAKMVLSARSVEDLQRVQHKCIELGKEHGLSKDDVLVLPMDMTDLSCHEAAVKQVLAHFGRLDVMVHNAGRSQRAHWGCIDLAVDRQLFELNVFSIVHLTRLILPHFEVNRSGHLAIMSSSAGKFGAPFSCSYTATKHALHGYFESFRNEKIGSGIDVTILCPGPTFSNLLEVAETEQVGKPFGEKMMVTDNRMTSERCAHLSLVALANRLDEAWICFFPALQLMYIHQWMPSTLRSVMGWIGPNLVQRIRDSRKTVKYE